MPRETSRGTGGPTVPDPGKDLPSVGTGRRTVPDPAKASTTGENHPSSRSASGHLPLETVRPTAHHKFYSLARAQWLSAEDLQPGEILRGLTGPLQVISQRPVPGTHRVYNMTVEGEHVYHVSTLGVLAHNNCTIGIRRNPKSGKIEQLLPANGQQASLKGSRWNTAPPIKKTRNLLAGLEDHHAIPRSLLEGQNPHDFVRIAKVEGVDIVKAEWNIRSIPHRGGHTDAYYGAVRSRVDEVYTRYLRGGSNWDASRIDAELSQVADGIFADIASGKLKLYK